MGKKYYEFKPIAYFGGNLILAGASYIFLRQYKRYFLYLIAYMISAIFLSAFYIQWVVVIASSFDAFFLSKKVQSKEIPLEERNWVMYLSWILWWGLFAASIVQGVMLEIAA